LQIVSEALMLVVNINAVILQAKIVRTFADLPFSVIGEGGYPYFFNK